MFLIPVLYRRINPRETASQCGDRNSRILRELSDSHHDTGHTLAKEAIFYALSRSTASTASAQCALAQQGECARAMGVQDRFLD